LFRFADHQALAFLFVHGLVSFAHEIPQSDGSFWVEAQLARSGKKVMQFLSEGRYVANVVDGKVTLYGR
jgi:hypothetical protein